MTDKTDLDDSTWTFGASVAEWDPHHLADGRIRWTNRKAVPTPHRLRVRAPMRGWAEVRSKLGAAEIYTAQTVRPGSAVALVELGFWSREEAERAAALAALLGYTVRVLR